MGKYVFIGDIHACYEELLEVLKQIPDDRTIVFLGDAFDRGPYGLKTLDLIYDMVFDKKNAKYIPGNHCNKFYRWCKGNQVSVSGGIKTIIAELDNVLPTELIKYKLKFVKLYEASSKYLILERGKILAVHAGWKDDVLSYSNERDVENICLYNNVINQKGKDGYPLEWVDQYQGDKMVIRGHIVYDFDKPYITNNVYSIDTGCVHGGSLTGLLYPEMDIIQTKAKKVYHASKLDR